MPPKIVLEWVNEHIDEWICLYLYKLEASVVALSNFICHGRIIHRQLPEHLEMVEPLFLTLGPWLQGAEFFHPWITVFCIPFLAWSPTTLRVLLWNLLLLSFVEVTRGCALCTYSSSLNRVGGVGDSSCSKAGTFAYFLSPPASPRGAYNRLSVYICSLRE